jgi:hypothetical protein
VDDAFFWSDPAELRVGDEIPPCLSPIGNEGIERFPLDAVGEDADCGADDFVASADGKGLLSMSGADFTGKMLL